MPDKPRLTREQIAQRAALELPNGAYVNLGWGIPNLIADYLPKDVEVYFHSENGILGMGRRARPGEEDYDLVDAMKVPVTLIPGASFFHQADFRSPKKATSPTGKSPAQKAPAASGARWISRPVQKN
jgi:acyl CoA:acetate/3-ketoacid CoA transferase beta subunit